MCGVWMLETHGIIWQARRRAGASHASLMRPLSFGFACPLLQPFSGQGGRRLGLASCTMVCLLHALIIFSWSHNHNIGSSIITLLHFNSSPPPCPHPHIPPPAAQVDKAACSRRPCVDLLLLRFVVVDRSCRSILLASASQAFIPHPTSSPCICWAGTCMSCMPRAFPSSPFVISACLHPFLIV